MKGYQTCSEISKQLQKDIYSSVTLKIDLRTFDKSKNKSSYKKLPNEA